METALSTISALPSKREEVVSFKRALKNEILAGDRKPLPVLVQLTCIQRSIEDTLKDPEIEHHFNKEFDLYGKEKVIEVNGANLQQQETGVKYSYDESGDPVWSDLNKQIQELTEKRKEREKFLQNIPYDKGTVDPETGVFITRPPKSSKTKVIVKLV